MDDNDCAISNSPKKETTDRPRLWPVVQIGAVCSGYFLRGSQRCGKRRLKGSQEGLAEAGNGITPTVGLLERRDYLGKLRRIEGAVEVLIQQRPRWGRYE